MEVFFVQILVVSFLTQVFFFQSVCSIMGIEKVTVTISNLHLQLLTLSLMEM